MVEVMETKVVPQGSVTVVGGITSMTSGSILFTGSLFPACQCGWPILLRSIEDEVGIESSLI